MSKPPDTDVLGLVGMSSIEVEIHKHSLCWTGHLIREDDKRIPKQIMFEQIKEAKRLHHKPKACFKDSIDRF